MWKLIAAGSQVVFWAGGLGLLAYLVGVMLWVMTGHQQSGVQAHPSGDASLIMGTACVINDAASVTDEAFYSMAMWCLDHRHDPIN